MLELITITFKQSIMSSNFTNSRANWSARKEYLRTIEEGEEHNGQGFEHLEVEEMSDAKEYQIMKQCESLKENRMHIVKFYV